MADIELELQSVWFQNYALNQDYQITLFNCIERRLLCGMSKFECLRKCNVEEKNCLCCFKGKILPGPMRLKVKQVSTQYKVEYSSN